MINHKQGAVRDGRSRRLCRHLAK